MCWRHRSRQPRVSRHLGSPRVREAMVVDGRGQSAPADDRGCLDRQRTAMERPGLKRGGSRLGASPERVPTSETDRGGSEGALDRKGSIVLTNRRRLVTVFQNKMEGRRAGLIGSGRGLRLARNENGFKPLKTNNSVKWSISRPPMISMAYDEGAKPVVSLCEMDHFWFSASSGQSAMTRRFPDYVSVHPSRAANTRAIRRSDRKRRLND
jgi:hypothetical protein